MFKCQILAGVPVIFLVLSFVACEPQIVKLKHDDITYEVPILEGVTVGAENAKFYAKNALNAMSQVRKVIDDMFNGVYWFNVVRTAYGVRQYEQEIIESKGYKSKRKDGVLRQKLVRLLVDVLKIDGGCVNGAQDCDKESLKHRAFDFLKAIDEIIRQNGVFLDWSEMKINGQGLVEYLTPVIRWFNSEGYGKVLFMLRKRMPLKYGVKL